jgi:hypothetical protein
VVVAEQGVVLRDEVEQVRHLLMLEVRRDDRPDTADVDVHATIYGPCEAQPCSPPGDATLELR